MSFSKPSSPSLPSAQPTAEWLEDNVRCRQDRELTQLSLASPLPIDATKQKCSRQGCNRILRNISSDPHNVCISCQGLCSGSSRCAECESWDNDTVENVRSYQAKLEQLRTRYATSKGQGGLGAPLSPSSGTGSASKGALSLVASVAPQDCVSQIGPPFPTDMAHFQSTSFRSVISEVVAK